MAILLYLILTIAIAMQLSIITMVFLFRKRLLMKPRLLCPCPSAYNYAFPVTTEAVIESPVAIRRTHSERSA